MTQIVSNKDRSEVLVRVQITDLPGSFLEKPYYKKSLCDLMRNHDGIIVAVDSTKSFDEVKQDLEKLCKMVDNCAQEQSDIKKEYRQYKGRPKCIIIALTKVDLVAKVQVTIEQAQGFLDTSNLSRNLQSDIRIVETSALYGINIFVLFRNLVQMCHNSRSGARSNLYDFWKHPIMAESVLESWGIKYVRNEKEINMRSNQQKTDVILTQQVHSNSNQQSDKTVYQHDQPHQQHRQITISSPATVIDSPEWPRQSMEEEQNMSCLTIGNALLDSCPVERIISGSKRSFTQKPGLNMVKLPSKPVLTLVSNISDDVVKYSPSFTSPMSDEPRESIDCSAYAWSGMMEHRRSVSSVISMIEDKDSAKEPESCKEMEKRLSTYRGKMMEAKENNQFAVANMYKQEVIKCQLLLSETKNRRDRVTKLLNRNAFDEDLPVFQQICGSKNPGLKGIILAIDLMNFKLLNDEHGHVNGDRALREFGRALKRVTKKMAEVSGKAWNVYRVGGDEFAITALVRSCDRNLFKTAAQGIADINIPWVDLVADCTSEGAIFARVGGVFGKYAKYEDADIIERNIKERNKFNRKTLMQPWKIQRVLLYYLDTDDRNEVITEYENEIEEAVRMRKFSRCSEIQEYIKFLQEGFLSLKKENLSDGKEDSTLLRGNTGMWEDDTTLYSTNAIQRVTKRTNLEEVYNIDYSGSESSAHKFLSPAREEGIQSSPRFGFQETKLNNNDAESENRLKRRGMSVGSPDLGDPSDDPPPYHSESEKEGEEFLAKPQATHRARPSQSMSEISEWNGQDRRIQDLQHFR